MSSKHEILSHIQALSTEKYLAGMAKFGIQTSRAFGVSVTILRNLAKTVKQECKQKNISLHDLAGELWETEFHEARILAILLENHKEMTEDQIESWVRDLDSWDVCDQLCSKLLWRLPNADKLITAWSAEEPEFVCRAAFALIAAIAIHDKKAPDTRFHAYFPLLEQYSSDERNFVKKAVNWAIRQIGKRNPALLSDAIVLAKRIQIQQTKSALWISRDALRELESYTFREKSFRSQTT